MTDLLDRAKFLKTLFDQGSLTQEKYDHKMDELLAEQANTNPKKHARNEGTERSDSDKAEQRSPSKKKGVHAEPDPNVVVHPMEEEEDDDDDEEEAEEEEEEEEEQQQQQQQQQEEQQEEEAQEVCTTGLQRFKGAAAKAGVVLRELCVDTYGATP